MYILQTIILSLYRKQSDIMLADNYYQVINTAGEFAFTQTPLTEYRTSKKTDNKVSILKRKYTTVSYSDYLKQIEKIRVTKMFWMKRMRKKKS